MKQYVIEVDDNTTLTEEDVKGAQRVREAQLPILNCRECIYLTYEDGGHMEWYAYCKRKREIIWGSEHWCTFGEYREKENE